MSLPDVPNTKREGYYSVMAGQRSAETLPENPVSTEDRYLDYIARNGGGGGGGGGDVTGVKGDAEETYRTGNVNITAANVGAYTTTQTNTLLNGKTDIVEGATENNFAAFDDSGNLTDSGKKAADFATPSNVAGEEIAGTATGTSITLTDSADANLQAITVKGRSEVISEEIVSVGDAGWGIVDLGTLTWTYESTYSFFYSEILDTITRTKALCARYNFIPETSAPADMPTGSFTIFTNYRMYVKDTTFTDAATFKSTMSGVLLYYPLADTTGATPIFGITSKNSAGQGTAATITTGLPLRSTFDGTVHDELTNEKVITRCEVVNNEVVPLATPVETPLTSAEKSALASLRTYDHTTHIDATDEPTMTVDYLLNTNNGQAVAKVDNKIGEKYTTAEKTKLAGVQDNATANEVIDTFVTLTVGGWVGNDAPYTQTVNVTGVLSTDQAIVDLSVSSTVATGLDEIDDWALISKIETGAGTMTFTCYEDKPTTELTANVHIVRGTSSGAASPVLKSVTWTGTGTTTRSITFPEKPTLVLSIQLTNKPSTNAGTVPFRYGAPSVFCVYGSNTSSWSGSYASALTYSVDELTMTITGSDKGSAWNDETTDYILYYM